MSDIFKMTFSIDQEKCIGCGACASQCPNAFQMNSATNKAEIKKSENSECDANIQDICPVQAIAS